MQRMIKTEKEKRISFVSLLRVFDCLIDTAERTTDLDNVYNDKARNFVEWSEVHKLRDEIFNAAKLEQL